MSDSNIEPGGAPPPQPNTLNPRLTGTVVPGMAVYPLADGTIGPARANASGTAGAVGIALIPATTGERGQYRYSGPVTLEDWTDASGTADLTPGEYWVSQATAGMITSAKPGSGIATYVGRAVSARTLLVAPSFQTAGG